MFKHDSGVVEGAAQGYSEWTDLDRLTNLADLDIENCPSLDIPEWLHSYRAAVVEIGRMVETGDHKSTVNDLLNLRSRILRRLREMTRWGAQFGYSPRTTSWFAKSDWD